MNKRETLTGENRAPIADNQNSITAGINQSCWPPESHAAMGSLLEFENSCGEVRNLNALIDSMIWGGLNTLKPPYVVCIAHTAGFPATSTSMGRASCVSCLPYEHAGGFLRSRRASPS
jgi:hypothetical protein